MMKLGEIQSVFKGLPPFVKVLTLLGIAMIIGSGGVEVSGYSVADDMHRWFFVGGFALIIVASISNLTSKLIAVRMKALDVDIRKTKIEGGLDPRDDETVVRSGQEEL